MADKITGTLEVGANDRGEVMVYLPAEVVRDFSLETGGHIVFSPNQARNLAGLLLRRAVQVGDTIFIGDLTATVEAITFLGDEMFFATQYGDFNASICSVLAVLKRPLESAG